MEDYAMFTSKGNNAVAKVVRTAINNQHTWPWVLAKLDALGNRKGTEEAYDTDVREHAFDAMDQAGALPTGQSFWG
jgi:hypothetical protein